MQSHQQYIEQYKNYVKVVMEEHRPTGDSSLTHGSLKYFQSYLHDYGPKLKTVEVLLKNKANELLALASKDSSIDIIKMKDDVSAIALNSVKEYIAKSNP